MRHTVEEKRKMRNERKKRKRSHKSELKRAALIKDALREVQRKTDEQRSIASKYYKLWRRSVETNKKLQNKLDNRESSIKKVYKY
jgi:predicted solute-binding protein